MLYIAELRLAGCSFYRDEFESYITFRIYILRKNFFNLTDSHTKFFLVATSNAKFSDVYVGSIQFHCSMFIYLEAFDTFKKALKFMYRHFLFLSTWSGMWATVHSLSILTNTEGRHKFVIVNNLFQLSQERILTSNNYRETFRYWWNSSTVETQCNLPY